jgi:hypothetical protein
MPIAARGRENPLPPFFSRPRRLLVLLALIVPSERLVAWVLGLALRGKPERVK